jgi:hypothetical protein
VRSAAIGKAFADTSFQMQHVVKDSGVKKSVKWRKTLAGSRASL